MKTFIEKYLLCSKNKINSNRIKYEWFIKNGFEKEYNTIINSSSEDIGISQKIYNIYYDADIPFCRECKINLVSFKNFAKGYREFCSCKCSSNNKGKQEQIKKTNLEKYGVTSPAKSIEILEKIKKTNIEKYGFEYALSCPKIQEKVKETNLKKYGVGNFQQNHISTEIFDKINDRGWLIDQHHTEEKTITKIAEELGINKRTLLIYARKHNVEIKRFSVSSGERELVSFLSEYTRVETCNRELIRPLELDIFLPEYNIAIEFNGLYWHCDIFKNQDYHINKTTECEKAGIQLIHIFEDEWNDKKEIVKSILLAKLGIFKKKIYARQCELVIKNTKEIRLFVEQNHIQGNANSGFYYCLYHKGELVAVASVGKSRFNLDFYELIRFCNKLNYSISGGFSKLLSAIKKDYPAIYSYSDLRYFKGNVYSKFGTFIRRTEPGYFWSDGNKRISRYKTQKNKLKSFLSDEYDSNMTENQNMTKAGFFKIYDCGNNLYLL